MVGRHEHDERRAGGLRTTASLRGHSGAEVRRCYDDRHAAVDVIQRQVRQLVAFGVGQGELLRPVREDADCI